MAKEILVAKQAIIDEVTEKMQNAQSVVVAEYRGLSVAEVTELRTALREENVELKVYKNNLVKRATAASDNTGLDEYLTGPNAIAFGNADAVAPARILAKFAKDHDALVIKAGIVEGKVMDRDGIIALSKLPGRDGMYSMIAAMLKEPTAKVARVVKALADKKAEGGEAAPEETAAAE